MTIEDNYMPMMPSEAMSDADQQAAFEAFHREFVAWSGSRATVEADRAALGCRAISIRTWVAGGLTLAMLSLIPFGDFGPVFGTIFGIIFGIATLAWLVSDYKSRASAATTPTNAYRAFFNAIRAKRTGPALAFVAPGGRILDNPIVPTLEKGTVTGTTPRHIETPKDLIEYYKTFLLPSGGFTRTSRIVSMKEVYSTENRNVVDVEVEIEVSAYPNWVWVGILLNLLVVLILMYAFRKKDRIVVCKRLMLGKNGHWYLCNPVANGPFDLAAAPR